MALPYKLTSRIFIFSYLFFQQLYYTTYTCPNLKSLAAFQLCSSGVEMVSKIEIPKILTEDEYNVEIKRPGLTVMDVYTKWAGPCEPMHNVFRRLIIEIGDEVRFVQAQTDSISQLDQYKNKSCPTILFFLNGEIAGIVRGADSPSVEHLIHKNLEELKKGNQVESPITPESGNEPDGDSGGTAKPPGPNEDAVKKEESSNTPPPPSQEPPSPPKEDTNNSNSVEQSGTSSLQQSTSVVAGPSGLAKNMDLGTENNSATKSSSIVQEQPGSGLPEGQSDVGQVENTATSESNQNSIQEKEKEGDSPSLEKALVNPSEKEVSAENAADMKIETENEEKESGLPTTENLENVENIENKLPEQAQDSNTDSEVPRVKTGMDEALSPQESTAYATPTNDENEWLKKSESNAAATPKPSNLQNSVTNLNDGETSPSSAEPTTAEAETPQVGQDVINNNNPSEDNGKEETLALFKPDVSLDEDKVEKMKHLILENGFIISSEKMVWLTDYEAASFYKEHEGKSFVADLLKFMTSAPIYAFRLERQNAVKGWRELLGPTNSEKAKADFPSSIRALFGTDGQRNAAHGSDSLDSAKRELTFFFSESMKTYIPTENTLALIKPDVSNNDAAVLRIKGIINENGFQIVKEKRLQMTPQLASMFYQEHAEKSFFADIINLMTSGPIIAMQLQKENAIQSWRDLLGPTNSFKAKEESPNSIRALFGTDGQKNAAHGSDSKASSLRELSLIFSPNIPELNEISSSTLAIIKPDVSWHDTWVKNIKSIIQSSNITIKREKLIMMDSNQAGQFYKEHEEKTFFGDLVAFMTSGPIIAMELEGKDVVTIWRKLIGPTNSEKARAEQPESIRALFGIDGQRNAVHGSDSLSSANREVSFLFSEAIPSYVSTPQTTLALLKPDIAGNSKVEEEIRNEIVAVGLSISSEKRMQFSNELASTFYAEHVEKPFFSNLLGFMTSGPILALTVTGPDAIRRWRVLIGPTNSIAAKEKNPKSLRAKFGTDGEKNACHGSDSVASALREVDIIFGTSSQTAQSVQQEQSEEITLALLKPDVSGDKIICDQIRERIIHEGLSIQEEKQVWLTRDQAAAFYKEHSEKPFFNSVLEFMSCAPVLALKLKGPDAIKRWRSIMGPTNSHVAKEQSPQSIRGFHGKDEQRNAVHGSDSEESAQRELNFIFSENIAAYASPNDLPDFGRGNLQKTVAIIKPDAVLAGISEDIIRRILARGYTIILQQETQLTLIDMKTLYTGERTDSFYDEAIDFVNSAKAVTLVLEGLSVVRGWMEMAGPDNPSTAKSIAPNSLRALHGKDLLHNVVHASRTEEEAILHISSILANPSRPTSAGSNLKAIPDATTTVAPVELGT